MRFLPAGKQASLHCVTFGMTKLVARKGRSIGGEAANASFPFIPLEVVIPTEGRNLILPTLPILILTG